MSTRNRLKNVLIKKLQISNKDAELLIIQKKVFVNGISGSFDTIISSKDTITLNDKVVYSPPALHYILYNKPPGIESTLNTEIANNLAMALGFPEKVFPVGRLDKASEGLMLLTNDGTIFDKILRKEAEKEKEYYVEVDRVISTELLCAMRQGMVIMGKHTIPAIVFQETAQAFRIILKEGLNRQIRRMCYKYGYKVTLLRRTRIMHLQLDTLAAGQWRKLSKNELDILLKNIETCGIHATLKQTI